jgi:hypothetical protein
MSMVISLANLLPGRGGFCCGVVVGTAVPSSPLSSAGTPIARNPDSVIRKPKRPSSSDRHASSASPTTEPLAQQALQDAFEGLAACFDGLRDRQDHLILAVGRELLTEHPN